MSSLLKKYLEAVDALQLAPDQREQIVWMLTQYDGALEKTKKAHEPVDGITAMVKHWDEQDALDRQMEKERNAAHREIEKTLNGLLLNATTELSKIVRSM